jgi:hypothetical protein
MPKGKKRKVTMPARSTRAAFVPATFNEDENSIQIVWTTGAEGERCEWDGEVYLESLRVDEASIRMDRLNSGAPVLDAHQSHEMRKQIGVVTSAWIDDGEGHAIVKFSNRAEIADLVSDIRNGIIRNISVGYVVYHYERVIGEDGQPDKLIATDWEPLEISFVPVPFDAGAQVRGGVTPRTFTANVTNRSKGKPQMRTVQQIRTAMNKARASLVKAREVEDEAKIVEAQEEIEALAIELDAALDTLDEGTGAAGGGEDGEGQPNAPPAGETEEQRKKREEEEAAAGEGEDGEKRERSRAKAIRTFGQQFKVEGKTIEDLIERGVSVSDAKLEMLIALQSRQSNFSSSNGGNVAQANINKAREAMQEAILHRAAPSKHKVTEGAKRFRGFTMIDLARESIRMAGGNPEGMTRQDIAKLALNVSGQSQQRAAGMHSTSDFPGILGNTINRSLRAAYEEREPTWLPLGTQNNFVDFRERTSIALGEASRLEKVREGGEYKYGSLPEEGSPMRAEKWGKIIAYTWEMMVNDDLGAFDRVPTALANSARQTESDVIWDLFITDRKWSDGANVFSAGHGNLAGTASAITIASLQAARTAMRTQKGIDKKTFINVEPRYLVVGPLNELAAYQLTSSAYTPINNATINPIYNSQLIVIVEPRITDYSWFLVGDNNETFEYGYLDGEGGMTTDTREGFEVDGIEVKARLVFGAGFVDYRGVYKNAGVAP